jgi:alpha-glucosidase (family GH31 glycosyl hydrolase)
MDLQEYHVPDFEPVADDASVVTGPNCRFTVLSSRLVRLEHDPDETFEDRPSQLVWYRDQPVPEFDVEKTDERLRIETDHLTLEYEYGDGFTGETLSIELADGTVWSYDDEEENLGGALRTLDMIDGPAELEDGLLSRDGWAVVDDTDRLVFDDEGWVTHREAAAGYEDLYFFGYETDFEECLSAYTDITGEAPMLPRWALGNWWSRYWDYSQDELRQRVEEFQEYDLPLSVCMIDMDWHVVDNPHHNGWTGWTWDDESFPDPEGFVDWLHEQDVTTSLNLHPADGVHPHEDQYEAFAEFVNIDPESEEPIPFDASDPEFLRGYFDYLIDPMEDEEGIDFWWIDWQQWEESPEMEGLDPMWALNHLHALDRTRDGKRPFILSRWPELGGHRYPIGFSGDTIISWDSLRFQPHLTARSANVDFGWWSHDIGGHIGGTGDPDAFGELYARWTQFGAFNPINRIHTTQSPSVDKRPWEFGGDVFAALADALRLRHALVPYLYTMAWRDHTESVPLVRPMYFHHPEAEAAYTTPHQYYFGSELVAAPHLSERDDDTNLARRSVWLPEGEWFDVFSGEQYDGDRWHARYGDLEDLPVYAKAGAIVPTDPDVGSGDVDNPDRLRIVAFPGDDNEFELYEDDGTSLDHRDGAFVTTRLTQHYQGDRLEFEIGPAEGDRSLVPDEREYEVAFRGVVDPDSVSISVPGEQGGDERVETNYIADEATLAVELPAVAVTDGVRITLETEDESLVSRRDRTDEHFERILHHCEMPVSAKDQLLEETFDTDDLSWVADYLQVMSASQKRAFFETLTGAGMDCLDHDGEERIVLWNPEERSDVRFRYTAWEYDIRPFKQGGDSEANVVPEFDRLDFDEEDVDATVAVHYSDLATVTVESSSVED